LKKQFDEVIQARAIDFSMILAKPQPVPIAKKSQRQKENIPTILADPDILTLFQDKQTDRKPLHSQNK
jgi:hypothetical protein